MGSGQSRESKGSRKTSSWEKKLTDSIKKVTPGVKSESQKKGDASKVATARTPIVTPTVISEDDRRRMQPGFARVRAIYGGLQPQTGGLINRQQARAGAAEAGIPLDDAELVAAYEAAGLDPDTGLIDYREFVVLLGTSYLASDDSALLNVDPDIALAFRESVDAFAGLDTDRDGYVNRDELVDRIRQDRTSNTATAATPAAEFVEDVLVTELLVAPTADDGTINYLDFISALDAAVRNSSGRQAGSQAGTTVGQVGGQTGGQVGSQAGGQVGSQAGTTGGQVGGQGGAGAAGRSDTVTHRQAGTGGGQVGGQAGSQAGSQAGTGVGSHSDTGTHAQPSYGGATAGFGSPTSGAAATLPTQSTKAETAQVASGTGAAKPHATW